MSIKTPEESVTVKKGSYIAFALLFNAFVWFFMILTMINNILTVIPLSSTQIFLAWTAYYVTIIVSSIIGSILSTKISRLNLIFSWITLGVITSSIPILLNNFSAETVIVTCVLWGVSFGLGMPSCLAYFADRTLVENRGRTGGIILLITNITAPIFVILFGMTNLMVNSIIFTLWRATGLLTFFFGPTEAVNPENKKKTPFTSILFNRSFLLFFIAWFMFCLVDRFEMPILRDFFGDFHYIVVMMGPIVGSLSALVAGILSDQIGRKRVVLFGFATLGIAYGIMGLAPTEKFSWYFYSAIGSISTGILWVIFWLIIWGDLSQHSSREKYYAIGGIPFFLTTLISQYLISVTDVLKIQPISAFSLASFFLFLAVLPLLYAPETLPEKKMELRRLRKYVETAKKVEQRTRAKKTVKS